jgi:hypothetical protein
VALGIVDGGGGGRGGQLAGGLADKGQSFAAPAGYEYAGSAKPLVICLH